MLKKKLKEYYKQIRLSKLKFSDILDNALEETYLLLVKMLGKPPNKFEWEYLEENNKFKRKENLTPLKFYESMKIKLNNYVCLIHDPRNKYYKNYNVEYLNNIIEGDNIKYLNIEIDEMKKFVKSSIDKNESVWFGCDVDRHLNFSENRMDLDLYDMNNCLKLGETLNKKERLEYYDSIPTHAMVITGYNVDSNNKINRWQIENSWGENSSGENMENDENNDYNGYYSMTDKWFDEYVFEVIINKKYLPKKINDIWKGKIYKSFPIWDPFGNLA